MHPLSISQLRASLKSVLPRWAGPKDMELESLRRLLGSDGDDHGQCGSQASEKARLMDKWALALDDEFQLDKHWGSASCLLGEDGIAPRQKIAVLSIDNVLFSPCHTRTAFDI